MSFLKMIKVCLRAASSLRKTVRKLVVLPTIFLEVVNLALLVVSVCERFKQVGLSVFRTHRQKRENEFNSD